MALLYLAALAVLLLVTVGLIYAATRTLNWGFSKTEGGTKPKVGRKIASIALVLLVSFPLLYPFLRDGYRNALCSAEAGAKVFVPATEWVPKPNVQDKRYQSVMVGDAVRTFVAAGLAEDYGRRSRGLGVY